MNNKVYWSNIEYKHKDKGLAGGFVYAFLKATDVREALIKLLIELNNQSLNTVEVEFISPYNEKMEWDTLEQTEHFLSLYQESKKSDNVIFDDFYAYETHLHVT
ncbi:hypothetical protein [Flavivirga eckloniae]|uniref:Uncharacterized protein n=1 Tax=Flavivirga eckloniae TaxID=1803846 RepID=A0A2K9PSP5_9FLAO|nr:hypothetical protein [Flavivirga eckloniae]AUP80090.1 hypothetical protein C1H87_15795 [Flavivirga eckloniae]